jgi:hypothetical protein
MNRKESLMDEIVEVKSELVVFDEVAAIIADYKARNEELVFDYESKEGVKEAKSHIAKLRKVKTKVSEIHKEAKAEALAFGRRLDAKKNEYNGEVDKMIDFHEKPLEAIKAKETEEALAKAKEYADAEAKRIAEIEARERAIILAEEKIAREKAEVEDKIRRENEAEADRVILEQQEKIAKIEKEKRIAEEEAEKLKMQAADKILAEAEAEEERAEAEEERLADIAAEKAIEANRIADKKHRAKVEADILACLTRMGLNDEVAISLLAAIMDNVIPHVYILY